MATTISALKLGGAVLASAGLPTLTEVTLRDTLVRADADHVNLSSSRVSSLVDVVTGAVYAGNPNPAAAVATLNGLNYLDLRNPVTPTGNGYSLPGAFWDGKAAISFAVLARLPADRWAGFDGGPYMRLVSATAGLRMSPPMINFGVYPDSVFLASRRQSKSEETAQIAISLDTTQWMALVGGMDFANDTIWLREIISGKSVSGLLNGTPGANSHAEATPYLIAFGDATTTGARGFKGDATDFLMWEDSRDYRTTRQNRLNIVVDYLRYRHAILTA